MKTLKTLSQRLTALGALALAIPAQGYDSPGQDYQHSDRRRDYNYDSHVPYYRGYRPSYYRVYRPYYYRVYRPYYYDQGYYDCGPSYSYYRPYGDYYRPSVASASAGCFSVVTDFIITTNREGPRANVSPRLQILDR